MVGRIGAHRGELRDVFDGPEFGDVEGAVRRQFDAQHVVDSDVRHDAVHAVGVLRELRAHQQAAVPAAFDRDFFGRGVLALDHVLESGVEIVEDVLLPGQIAGLVPLFAVFSAAAQIEIPERTCR